MKSKRYLEHVFGNKGSVSVLRTLVEHKGRVFTIRRLAEDSGISHTEASDTVQDLERLGIVMIQPIGRSHQVSLNEKSYILNKMIRPAIAAEHDLSSNIIMTLRNGLKFNEITSAVVFGSMARGEEKIQSDLDLLVISDNYDVAIEIVSAVAEDIFAKFHKKLSHIIFSKKQIKAKRGSDLVKSILKDHILVAGRDLTSVIK